MTAIAIATRGVIAPRGTGTGQCVRVEDPVLSAVELTPDVYAGLHLQPTPVSAEEQDDTVIPEMTGAEDLVPENTGGIELVPVMISAEEE